MNDNAGVVALLPRGTEPPLGFDAVLYATRLLLDHDAPLRVVRFVIAPGRHAPAIEFVAADQGLGEVLEAIGRRLQVRLGAALVGERELRVHGQDEVVIIKPAARRFWMPGLGLEDADAVVSESFVGAVA